MPLVCLGLSHRTAPVEVRERHAFPPERAGEALTALRDYEAVDEAVLIQTCGRIEIYAEIKDYELGSSQLRAFLQNYRHGAVEYDISSYMYTLLGRDAVTHLFRVSTGLDTMMIGEAEILAQVKEAHIAAQRAGSLGTILHKLFRESLGAGKAARTQTSIGQASPSAATAAIQVAKAELGTLEGRTIAIVGAGKIGTTAARRFREEHIARLILLNRTLERAKEAVRELGYGEARELRSALAETLDTVDAIVTSTGGPHFVLHAHNIGPAMERRAGRSLLIIDLAVPRDTDPAVTTIPGVRVIDVDALKNYVNEKLEVRREAIPAVESIVREYSDRFMHWYQTRETVPVIASLTQKAEAIREAELQRLFARCPDLSERDRLLIASASTKIISRLLHTVITNVRGTPEERENAIERARLLEELFELDAPR